MRKKHLIQVLIICVIFITPLTLPINKVTAEDSSLSIDSVEWGYVRVGLWAYIKSKVKVAVTNHGSSDIAITKVLVNNSLDSFYYEGLVNKTINPNDTVAFEIIFLEEVKIVDNPELTWLLVARTYLIWRWNTAYTITTLTSEGLSVSKTCLTPL